LQDALPFFLSVWIVFLSSASYASVLISSAFASTSTFAGDALEPISSTTAGASAGFSAACLAAASAATLAF
tara:strand:+ start:74 stop:286 length:213 start_codon:yes stop_codon:yes gene_type:complete